MKDLHCGPCEQCKAWRKVELLVLGALTIATLLFVLREFP